MRTRRGLFLGVLTVVVSVSTPGPLDAQGCNSCSDGICSGWQHHDDCGTAYWGFSSNCHADWCAPGGPCWTAHIYDCGFLGALSPTEIGLVLNAAESEDVDALLMFLSTSDQVWLNAERRSIQVASCHGQVIANVVLSTEGLQRLDALSRSVVGPVPTGDSNRARGLYPGLLR